MIRQEQPYGVRNKNDIEMLESHAFVIENFDVWASTRTD
jgi:hypothetical protein